MKVSKFAGDAYIYTFPLFGQLGGTIAPGWSIRGCITSDYQKPQYTKDFLVDSEKDAFGERSCTHYALDGSVLAVPSGTMSVRNITILHHFRDVSPTYLTQEWRWNEGNTQRTHVGPMLFITGKIDYRHKFPNFHAPSKVSAHVRNIEVIVKTIGKDRYMITGHMELSRSPSNPNSWTNWDTTWFIQVDRLSMSYRTNDGPLQPMERVKIVPKDEDTPSFSMSSLPSTGESYRNINGILRRKFVLFNDDHVYGDLVRRCANDTRTIPTNSIGLVAELAGISTTLRTIFKLGTGKVDASTIASAYLSYKYGPRLTAMDLKTVVKGLGKRVRLIDKDHSRSRAREVHSFTPVVGSTGHLNVTWCYKMIYRTHTDDLRDFLRNWFNSGLFPSLTNAWDLIPLSFVLDWFFKVEPYLNSIDANTYWSLYSIVDVIYSKKEVFSGVNWLVSQAGYTLVGDMTYKSYVRTVTSAAHKPLFFDPSPRVFKNYAELTSLIVAKR